MTRDEILDAKQALANEPLHPDTVLMIGVARMDRCIEGRLYRHKPFPHDPHFECDVGVCPDCQGRGCEQLERQRELFACRVCRAECPVSAGVGQAVCEEHCEDHDYEYQRSEGWHCKHCFAPRPHDWAS